MQEIGRPGIGPSYRCNFVGWAVTGICCIAGRRFCLGRTCCSASTRTFRSSITSTSCKQSTVVGVDAAYLTGRALLERFTSTSSKNFINYSNEEYDKLYQQVKTSTDEEEQVELYKKMETLLCDDAANLYIEDMACEVALRSDFAGYRFYPLYVQDMAKIYKVK